MLESRRRGGRQHKGPRVAFTVRLPAELHELVAAQAAADGVGVGAYMVRLAAEAHGVKAPADCYPSPQEGLPLAS